MAEDDWNNPITPEQLRKLRHLPKVVKHCTAVAKEIADAANQAAAQYNRPSQAGNPNYGIVVRDSDDTERARVYVRPMGRTGIHVEQAESVLLKIAGSMGAKGAQ